MSTAVSPDVEKRLEKRKRAEQNKRRKATMFMLVMLIFFALIAYFGSLAILRDIFAVCETKEFEFPVTSVFYDKAEILQSCSE